MDFLTGIFGDVAGAAGAGAVANSGGAGDMSGGPQNKVSQAQQAGGASSFQQLLQQVMQMNNSMPNMAQQAMQQAQKQAQPNNGWGQLLM